MRPADACRGKKRPYTETPARAVMGRLNRSRPVSDRIDSVALLRDNEPVAVLIPEEEHRGNRVAGADDVVGINALLPESAMGGFDVIGSKADVGVDPLGILVPLARRNEGDRRFRARRGHLE